jgi:hypothetical protein
VFDAAKRSIVYDRDISTDLGLSTGEQGPRIFVRDPEGAVYVLFVKGIVRVDPATYALTMLAESPVSVDAGGDFLDGRIYFSSGSHLCSYKVAK